MKIKARPEDFVVEEILAGAPKKNGPYTLLRLIKRQCNTLDAVQEIAARLRKPLADISYGGRKDKHACATQFITVKGAVASLHTKTPKFRLETAGYLDRPMGPDLIAANKFRIVVRNVNRHEKEKAVPRLKEIPRKGFFNYFDDQRFGPFDPAQGFLAEKIIRKHFNGAVKFYLTHRVSEDKKEDVRRKAFFFEHWGEWTLCLKEAASRTEKGWLSHLSEHPKDFLALLRKIPAGELAFHFASFQAFLWNEVLRRLIRRTAKITSRYPGLAGDYLFAEEGAEITGVIPTISSKMLMADNKTAETYHELLQEKGLKTSIFNLTKIRQAYFKSIDRTIQAIPEDMTYTFSRGETEKEREDLTLAFTLPRGCYATMLIKQVFAAA
ncbi:tRNA pseudouridine 13 synthase [Candidatus Velamenicoccus archaeovorus]|uniref:tRNA pseudouridine 13 synthase n=1 Tax=Velamenicoccus archaeovorus TaxID=1930593 RepID=A0A410P452_VELA1|nr:tRNA pseudouridine(13) synthase TruD [Candidatus Velamenicoccus archaeovorus]QAT16893.1 tRNA pseudouridine 13 synthase [Candidatus Velamenicoccus archaeovorus]